MGKKLGIGLRFDKGKERQTFASRDFNEMEWINSNYKNRTCFTEPSPLFHWKIAPQFQDVCVILLQRIAIPMLFFFFFLIMRGFSFQQTESYTSGDTGTLEVSCNSERQPSGRSRASSYEVGFCQASLDQSPLIVLLDGHFLP